MSRNGNASEGVRDLERIQESENGDRGPKLSTLAFVAAGGACIAFAAMTLGVARNTKSDAKADPLGALVSAQKVAAPTKATDLNAKDVTFPGILSDRETPTTALAAVRGKEETTPGPGLARAGEDGLPPTAGDRLPIAPLPAGNVLSATSVTTNPRDTLTKVAAAGSTDEPQAMAPKGSEGRYSLQVSSFKEEKEAEAFANQLRTRGHKAYVVAVDIKERGGRWYRVRVGPFASQQQAAAYRNEFEKKEHVVPFVVNPDKDKGDEVAKGKKLAKVD